MCSAVKNIVSGYSQIIEMLFVHLVLFQPLLILRGQQHVILEDGLVFLSRQIRLKNFATRALLTRSWLLSCQNLQNAYLHSRVKWQERSHPRNLTCRQQVRSHPQNQVVTGWLRKRKQNRMSSFNLKFRQMINSKAVDLYILLKLCRNRWWLEQNSGTQIRLRIQ